jgi:hypothetical protein
VEAGRRGGGGATPGWPAVVGGDRDRCMKLQEGRGVSPEGIADKMHKGWSLMKGGHDGGAHARLDEDW